MTESVGLDSLRPNSQAVPEWREPGGSPDANNSLQDVMLPRIKIRLLVSLSVLLLVCFRAEHYVLAQSRESTAYLGFDRNQYPGDDNLKALRKTFFYAGYWLNNAPGETTNTWKGKRAALEAAGFGYLVLFNGRLDKELKAGAAQSLARLDGRNAIAAARAEGFPGRTVIFLDIEEGGRMLPEQKDYIYTWVDAVSEGGFRAGVYCSGIPAREGKSTIVTAQDIRENARGRDIVYWITNDACPPSPGCAFPKAPPRPGDGGITFASVWQFAQSPRRKDFAAHCPANYNPDGNCYPPEVDANLRLHLDVNTADASDPSAGR
jgi:hypothetical protein